MEDKESNDALLSVKNLVLHFTTSRGMVRAVDGVSFSVRHGETLALVGESGSGKSSTALAIIRLLPRNVAAYRGSIIFEKTELMNLDDEEFRKRVRVGGISMVFQGAMNSFNPVLRVGFQVAEPLVVNMGMPREEAYKKAEDALELVGLERSMAQRYPFELSGGMKQRALIAMALITNPKLLILDEPTSALDVMTQANVMNLLKKLKKELGLTYIFITHDLALASELADRVAVMYGGLLAELGPSDELYPQPRHPYTELLINSVPFLRQDKEPTFIKGSPPDPVEPPTGCRFHPRCPYFIKGKCDVSTPPMFKVDGEHWAACWLLEEK
ncbi:peptide/nickel ABC transporter ATP-binding protein [Candidatus Caldarchaeum subterraneum]|uniref:Peptide/nickel ABC transporter ATP-binding protein n=1 Tax=Caldiarchaeum subterraneum TaxID=311458 RepID=E6N2Z6_CALS0|nr:peptide/nickel transport system ATP-binding protein [Candidatus Caldarchaeum subterraneum]BAJ48354.1 peptide/nickel ABC transporter ATP-binding protein [Candidatus Caldarchaeum subterraneum]BAJ51134.1 peptide/nickel ABC transporter ATP-binding protein [Candidatus Caldarchaeum subterraneum]